MKVFTTLLVLSVTGIIGNSSVFISNPNADDIWPSIMDDDYSDKYRSKREVESLKENNHNADKGSKKNALEDFPSQIDQGSTEKRQLRPTGDYGIDRPTMDSTPNSAQLLSDGYSSIDGIEGRDLYTQEGGAAGGLLAEEVSSLTTGRDAYSDLYGSSSELVTDIGRASTEEQETLSPVQESLIVPQYVRPLYSGEQSGDESEFELLESTTKTQPVLNYNSGGENFQHNTEPLEATGTANEPLLLEEGQQLSSTANVGRRKPRIRPGSASSYRQQGKGRLMRQRPSSSPQFRSRQQPANNVIDHNGAPPLRTPGYYGKGSSASASPRPMTVSRASGHRRPTEHRYRKPSGFKGNAGSSQVGRVSINPLGSGSQESQVLVNENPSYQNIPSNTSEPDTIIEIQIGCDSCGDHCPDHCSSEGSISDTLNLVCCSNTVKLNPKRCPSCPVIDTSLCQAAANEYEHYREMYYIVEVATKKPWDTAYGNVGSEQSQQLRSSIQQFLLRVYADHPYYHETMIGSLRNSKETAVASLMVRFTKEAFGNIKPLHKALLCGCGCDLFDVNSFLKIIPANRTGLDGFCPSYCLYENNCVNNTDCPSSCCNSGMPAGTYLVEKIPTTVPQLPLIMGMPQMMRLPMINFAGCPSGCSAMCEQGCPQECCQYGMSPFKRTMAPSMRPTFSEIHAPSRSEVAYSSSPSESTKASFTTNSHQ